MKVLIIGGTGLISTAITLELLKLGYDVTLYNHGKTEARLPAGAKIIVGDRKHFAAFESQMKEAGIFDYVIPDVGADCAKGLPSICQKSAGGK